MVELIGYLGGAGVLASYALSGRLMFWFQGVASVTLLVYTLLVHNYVFMFVQVGCIVIVAIKLIRSRSRN